MKKLFILAAASALFAFNASAQAANIVSDFNGSVGNDGWTSVDGASAVSNPGGYLKVTDISGYWNYVIAPEKFHGDWTKYKSVSADVLGDSDTLLYPIAFYIANGSKSQEVEFKADIKSGVWKTQFLDLTAGAFSKDILSNVTDFRIRIDLNDKFYGNEVDGIDNVKLTENAPVPEPSSMILGLMGISSMFGLRRKK